MRRNWRFCPLCELTDKQLAVLRAETLAWLKHQGPWRPLHEQSARHMMLAQVLAEQSMRGEQLKLDAAL